MTKAIKDIGLPVGQITRVPWSDSAIVTTTTTASDKPLGRFYTNEERRELVRRVWRACRQVSYPYPEMLDDFIEDEGL